MLKTFEKLLIIFITLYTLDAVQTIVRVSNNEAIEINPFVNLIGILPAMAILKPAMMAFAVGVVYNFEKKEAYSYDRLTMISGALIALTMFPITLLIMDFLAYGGAIL